MNMRTTIALWTLAGVLVAALGLATSVSAQSKAKTTKTTSASKVDIMLLSPTAPKSGDNNFEVMVKDADGKPLSDADVSVVLVMPKTTAMAEMRNEVKLKPSGNGRYTGSGPVMMAGTWTATMRVMKSGKELAQEKVTLTAK